MGSLMYLIEGASKNLKNMASEQEQNWHAYVDCGNQIDMQSMWIACIDEEL